MLVPIRGHHVENPPPPASPVPTPPPPEKPKVVAKNLVTAADDLPVIAAPPVKPESAARIPVVDNAPAAAAPAPAKGRAVWIYLTLILVTAGIVSCGVFFAVRLAFKGYESEPHVVVKQPPPSLTEKDVSDRVKAATDEAMREQATHLAGVQDQIRDLSRKLDELKTSLETVSVNQSSPDPRINELSEAFNALQKKMEKYGLQVQELQNQIGSVVKNQEAMTEFMNKSAALAAAARAADGVTRPKHGDSKPDTVKAVPVESNDR